VFPVVECFCFLLLALPLPWLLLLHVLHELHGKSFIAFDFILLILSEMDFAFLYALRVFAVDAPDLYPVL